MRFAAEIVLLLSFALSTGNSRAAVSFVVKQVNGGSFVLEGSCMCAPGTIIDFVAGPRFEHVLIKIRRRLESGTFEAVGAVADDPIAATLQVGDKGLTDSPLQAYPTLRVSWEMAKPSFLKSDRSSQDVDASKITPDLTVRHVGGKIEVEGLFGKRFVEEDELGRTLHTEASSFQLYKLSNQFVSGHKSQLILLNQSDLNEVGELPMGKPIVLAVSPLVKAYCSLLMIDPGGQVTVLYPNAASNPNVILPASSTRSFSDVVLMQAKKSGLAKLDIDASSPGPTIFVVIMSTERRPLTSFLPKASHLSFKGMKSENIDPATLGPGLWASEFSGAKEEGVSDLDPNTWDTASLRLIVTR